MIDDLQFGKRNKKGDWKPNEAIALPPMANAKRKMNLGGWLLGFIWPWNLMTVGLTALLWFFVIPPIDVMQTLSFDWIATLFAVNWIALFLWLGSWELVLYRKRSQERRFKYNNAFPSEKPADYFWFKDQNIDNFIRSMFISVPIMVAMEVFALWMFANGWGAISFATEQPILFVLLLIFIPVSASHIDINCCSSAGTQLNNPGNTTNLLPASAACSTSICIASKLTPITAVALV